MTTKAPLQLPAMFRGVRDDCEVRFTYTFKNGEAGYVSGRFVKFSGRTEEDGTRVVTGIEVKPNFNSRIPEDAKLTPEGNLRCAAERVTPDSVTGLVIPVSKKELANGTGGARYLLATDAQVRYALSLCGRDCPGGGNFYQPDEAEFRSMSRREISGWIDMAKDELGGVAVIRTDVYDASLFEESTEIWTAFDYDRIRGRWSDEDSDGTGSRGAGRGEAVILTGNGRAKWVLEKWTNWAGEAVRHERMDAEDARDWLGRNGFTAAVTEHFGGNIREALNDAAMYGEVTARRDEIIRACHSRGGSIAEIARLMRISRPTVYEVLGEKPAPPKTILT